MREAIFCCAFCLIYHCSISQDTIPVSATIEANHIKATVYSNGRLFGNETEGQFFRKGSDVPLLRSAGLWIIGLDPAGNLKGAVQATDSLEKNDFQPGLLDWEPSAHIDFNKIWRVTKEDIEAHREDYNDNFKIDNPIPAIYEWPGRGNPHFEEYNGFELPTNIVLADFGDKNNNRKYEPDNGDFPTVFKKGCNDPHQYPDEILWFSYHDKRPHHQSGMDPTEIVVQCHIFAYQCEDWEYMSKTLFAKYRIINRGIESIDSLFTGVYLDYQIGCPEDNFIGTLPDINTVFGYNATNFDQSCNGHPGLSYSVTAPALTIYRSLYTEYGEELGLTNTMPLYQNESNTTPGKRYPNTPEEYYSYINSHWADRTPLTFGDDGYQDGSTIKYIFPGNPANEWEWNEYSAEQTPGQRQMLAVMGPVRLDPGEYDEFIVGFSIADGYHNQDGKFSSDWMEERIYHNRSFFGFCFGGLPFTTWCNRPRIYEEPPPSKVNLSPIPARQELSIEFHDINPQTITVVNALGRIFYEWENPWERHVIDLSNWPTGIYFLLTEEEGIRITKKFIVQ